MSQITVSDLDSDIENISSVLENLNDELRCNLDDYCISKFSLSDETKDIVFSQSQYEENILTPSQKCFSDLNSDLKSISEKLETAVESYVFIKKILTLNDSLKCVEELSNTDICEASELLVKSKLLIDECSKTSRPLNFYKEKNKEYCNLLASISLTTIEKWNELIHFKSTEQDKVKTTSLTVNLTNPDSLGNTFRTLELLKISYKEMFQDNLMKDMIKPIILYDCNLQVENTNGYSCCSVSYSCKTPRKHFSEMVEDLIKLFSFINSSLDMKNSNGGFINFIGLLTACEFLTLFIGEHLKKKIPLKRIHLDDYKQAVDDTNRLAGVLMEKGFVPPENELLKEYCSDVEKVFEKKVGDRYKEVAATLMLRDLHDMLTIEPISLPHPMPDLQQVRVPLDEYNRDNWNAFITLVNNENRKQCFPRCQISKPIYELAVLIQDCLDEANLCSSTASICLHNAAHEIVCEYLKSPDIHRKLLDIIPQQSALIFTNTTYIAMKLVEFDSTFNTDKLFCELISQLQHMAFRELNKQILIQEDIVISSLHKSDLNDLSELEVLPKTVEKVVRQCLRQAMLLQTVWTNVLPEDIYCLAVGRLVNKFIDELINLIISASDIREDIANNLVDLFTLITDKAQQVFPESREVHRHVRSWLKLREVGLVLAGSLAEIGERWAGGSGPLAHELLPAQVRSLILALFQPSDIRQRTLASIK